MENRVRFIELGPDQEKLPFVIGNIPESPTEKALTPARVSIVAPYYFLIRSGISHIDLPVSSYFRGLRSFANNYTVQGFKIKECKPILNRVLCHLAMMSTEQLNACPFLRKLNRIYTIDLSFIPEKYRLDVKRAESILNTCLKRWLTALESHLQPECGQSPAIGNF